MKPNNQIANYETWASLFDRGCHFAQCNSLGVAKRFLTEATQLATQLGLKAELVESLICLGDIQRASGHTKMAKVTLGKAVLLAEELKLRRLHANALGSIAKLHLAKEEYSEAAQLLEKAAMLLMLGMDQMEIEDLVHFFAWLHVCDELGEWHKLRAAARSTYEMAKRLLGPRDAACVCALFSWAHAAIQLHDWKMVLWLCGEIRTGLKERQTDRLGYGRLLEDELECFGLTGKGPNVFALLEQTFQAAGVTVE